MIVNRGKEIVVDRIMGNGTEPKYVAIGTGAGTTAATDTTLFTEVETRATGTSSKVTTTTTNDTYRVVGTITATGARAVTNAGLFDATSVGNLFAKADFSTINLATNDQLQLTFNVQFS